MRDQRGGERQGGEKREDGDKEKRSGGRRVYWWRGRGEERRKRIRWERNSRGEQKWGGGGGRGVRDVNHFETFLFHTPLQLKPQTSTAEHLLCLASSALSSPPPQPTSLTNPSTRPPRKQLYPSLAYNRSLTWEKDEEEEEEAPGGWAEGGEVTNIWASLWEEAAGNESFGSSHISPNTTAPGCNVWLLWIAALLIQRWSHAPLAADYLPVVLSSFSDSCFSGHTELRRLSSLSRENTSKSDWIRLLLPFEEHLIIVVRLKIPELPSNFRNVCNMEKLKDPYRMLVKTFNRL